MVNNTSNQECMRFVIPLQVCYGHIMANKVVSFRINETLFEQIDKAKRSTGASYADLIKRGSNICITEVQTKLDEINRLSAKASHLRELIDKRDDELKKSFEQEKAERQAQIDREFESKRAVQEGELKKARSEYFRVLDDVDSQQNELVKLRQETEAQRAERDKVSKQLVQYQQKHSENQMTITTMMLAMMEIAGNMMQPSPQGNKVTSQNSKEVTTQQSKPGNYDYLEQPQQSTPIFASMITGLMPLFSLFMVMSMVTAITRPPKKKTLTPDSKAKPSALADFIKRIEEHQRELEDERREAKPEIADEQEVSDEEEEEEEDTTKDEEIEEEAEE